ncbi:MAG: Spy/CpxP family protein refolding chaperone [Nitrospirae bacterium]|nr:Spy/CpxP family protein refolding chaperone [Nitrospirota bacterium]
MRSGVQIVSVLGALILLAGSAWAGKTDHKPDREAWIEELGLSKDQQARIEGIRKEHRELVKKIKSERESLMKDLTKLVKEKAADADLQGKVDALHHLKKQVGEAMDRHMENLRGVLTPIQQAKFVLWMDKHRGSNGKPGTGED